ncbi:MULTISPECIES: hypothetical protein [Ferrimicrobium]|uniref:restriction endonuclease subunit S n=1 Tax=Ferrimicrobium TaxID=121038 RepID=UPI0023F14567|nr:MULTISPECIES: hypothetical protein [Ferrimicrobium]
MSHTVSIRNLIAHAVGGGWGYGAPKASTELVVVIRGADFPAIAVGDGSLVPVRWEERKKLPTRLLVPGDIVLEISGGTSDRPTGRTVFVSERLLESIGKPTIPASFCRLVRVDQTKADPYYVYWWLQEMYAAGRTWAYQNRSTGIANFQFEHFLDAEMIYLPSIEEQRAIAATLGALDDKIESNRRAIDLAEQLADQLFAVKVADLIVLTDVAVLTMGSSPPGDTYNLDGVGLPFYQGVRDFGRRYPGHRVWTTGAVRLAYDNDSLVSVRAPVGELNRSLETCCIGRGVAAVSSEFPSCIYYALRASDATWEPFQHEGTVFGAINKSDLSNARLPWPASDALDALENQLSAIDDKIRSLSKEIEELTSLRDTLLPELLSGRIRFPEVQEAIEAAI